MADLFVIPTTMAEALELLPPELRAQFEPFLMFIPEEIQRAGLAALPACVAAAERGDYAAFAAQLDACGFGAYAADAWEMVRANYPG